MLRARTPRPVPAPSPAAEIRSTTSDRIIDGLFPDGAPAKGRAVIKGWLWYMDGVLLDWIDKRDLGREEVRDLLLGSLFASLAAVDATPAGLPA